MTNIWESPEVLEALGNASDSGSTFLNKALGDGDSIKLKYTALLRQEQPDDTDERYRSPDGKIWRLEFEDTEGKERVMEQKTLKSRLISAMRSADVQIGQWIEITRTGLNTETEYEVVLLAANGEPQVAPTSTEDRPF